MCCNEEEACRKERCCNAHTNFAPSASSNSGQSGSSYSGDGRHGLSFTSLKAKLSKNLQSIMAQRNSAENKSLKSRVSDHFTFASIFHLRKSYPPMDMKRMERVVAPSVVVPSATAEETACSGETYSMSGCSSSEWIGFRQHQNLDSDGSDASEAFLGDQQMMAGGWVSSPEIMSASSNEGSWSKRFKVSSSVLFPQTFTQSPLRGEK